MSMSPPTQAQDGEDYRTAIAPSWIYPELLLSHEQQAFQIQPAAFPLLVASSPPSGEQSESRDWSSGYLAGSPR